MVPSPGFVSNVVFAREDDERHALGGAWASATQLRRRLRLANPSLAFLTGCSVNYMSREAMNSILSDDVFDSPLFAEVIIYPTPVVLIHDFGREIPPSALVS